MIERKARAKDCIAGVFRFFIFSSSIIFLCFHLFSKLKSVPKLIMMISNYSFSIYLLHAFILIFGLVILTALDSIGTVSAVLLLFFISTGPGWLFYFCLAYYCGKNYERFLALLERYRHAVYAAAAVTGCFIVAVSYFGQDIAVTSKRPDILLYSNIGYFILVIFQFYLLHMCFHSFLQKASPKWVLSISFAVTAAYSSYFTFIQPPVVQEEAPFPFSWVPYSEFLLAHAYPGGVPEGFLKKRFKTIFIPFLFIAVLDAFMTAGLMMQQFHASVIIKKLLANIFLGN
ncbi:hypothetical protein DT075_04625 [Bacillus licheniformis]|nr:hypothetical protein DT075_04625 [Bacillus licheniformis]